MEKEIIFDQYENFVMFSLVNNEYFSEEIVKEKVSDVMLDNIDLQIGNIIYENNNSKNFLY